MDVCFESEEFAEAAGEVEVDSRYKDSLVKIGLWERLLLSCVIVRYASFALP
jgi:hypothetical protein